MTVPSLPPATAYLISELTMKDLICHKLQLQDFRREEQVLHIDWWAGLITLGYMLAFSALGWILQSLIGLVGVDTWCQDSRIARTAAECPHTPLMSPEWWNQVSSTCVPQSDRFVTSSCSDLIITLQKIVGAIHTIKSFVWAVMVRQKWSRIWQYTTANVLHVAAFPFSDLPANNSDVAECMSSLVLFFNYQASLSTEAIIGRCVYRV